MPDAPRNRKQSSPPQEQIRLPHGSEVEVDNDQPTTRELEDEQMQFLTFILDQEVASHNKTRERVHRYLGLYMKQERELCSERVHTQQLDTVINNLRAQVKEEQIRRLQVEEEKTALLQESFNHFACVSPPNSNIIFKTDTFNTSILS